MDQKRPAICLQDTNVILLSCLEQSSVQDSIQLQPKGCMIAVNICAYMQSLADLQMKHVSTQAHVGAVAHTLVQYACVL